MPNMSSIDETFHATHDLIYTTKNPEPEISLVTPVNGYKESFRTLSEILRKANPPAVPTRMTVRELVQEKLKEVNQERVQMKIAPQ